MASFCIFIVIMMSILAMVAFGIKLYESSDIEEIKTSCAYFGISFLIFFLLSISLFVMPDNDSNKIPLCEIYRKVDLPKHLDKHEKSYEPI